MELLGDLVADSQFPERELAKEREVVADEINLYLDTPYRADIRRVRVAALRGVFAGA